MNNTSSNSAKQTVLVVDDATDNLALMCTILEGLYNVLLAGNGEQALEISQAAPHPDIILLDINMPVMDGYEACRRLKANPQTRDIPVIFLTGVTELECEMRGFELGAADYITKPFSPFLVLARLKPHLQLKRMTDFLRDQNVWLEEEVQRRTREVVATQEVTILTMASLAETRDNETGGHIRRTQHYLRVLAAKLRSNSRFSRFLDNDDTIEMLFKSAPLHDIGKVGIPDHILLKPASFTPAEYNIMKNHCLLGRNAIMAAEQWLGAEQAFLSFAKEIAFSHHEKWDGSGYPEGLAGDDIPISGRLMAVADVYDALISRRVYKEPLPHKTAVEIIVGEKNTHFDPTVVDAFLDSLAEFVQIARRFQDAEHGMRRTEAQSPS